MMINLKKTNLDIEKPDFRSRKWPSNQWKSAKAQEFKRKNKLKQLL